MTSEELAALKVGDEVLVRMRVAKAADEYGDLVASAGFASAFVARHSIHSLAPPKPLAVGDWTNRGRILAIHGIEAWVHNDFAGCFTQFLRDLTRTTEPTK